MKKTLVLYSRICPTESLHTKPIFDALSKLDNVTTKFIDGNNAFDVQKEVDLLKEYDSIVFLFTMNWYNIPWSLNRYLTEVWPVQADWAQKKNVYKVVTTGSSREHYSESGANAGGVSAEAFLDNLNSTIKRPGALVKESFFYHNAVEYDKQRLEAFINDVTTFFSK